MLNQLQPLAFSIIAMTKPQDLKPRTKAFALRVIRMCSDLPKNDTVAQVLGKQVLRSRSGRCAACGGGHPFAQTRSRNLPKAFAPATQLLTILV